MPIAPSYNDILIQMRAESKERRGDLTHFETSIVEAQIHAGAAMGDVAIRYGAQAFKETWLDGAKGDVLTKLVDDHMNIQRKPATASQVIVEFSRPYVDGNEPAGVITAGWTIATEVDEAGQEVQFETAANVSFLAGELGPKAVTATATITGTDGNALAEKVTRIVDSIAFDSTFLVTNPLPGGGGNPQESDDELRTRARRFYLTLRRGTNDALEYAALEVDSVRFARAAEEGTTGYTTLFVTDADGNSTLQMVNDVTTELESWRAAGGIPIAVTGGIKTEVDMVIQIKARAGFDVAAYADQFAEAAAARINKQRAGETLYLGTIRTAISCLAADDILNLDFTSIVLSTTGNHVIEDVVPVSAEVFRAGTITVVGE